MRILVIEDNRDIAANLGDFLEDRGHTVDFAADGVTGLHLAVVNDFDAIVLDLNLPGMDGIEVCRKLRQEARRQTPVLMLTARDTLDDKLRGFATGADDYMVKPFAMRELEVRIRNLHRRGRPVADAPLHVGDLSYDSRSMLATRAGQRIALTRAQAAILTALMRDAPGVIGHKALLRAVWGEDGGDVAALHTHVYALRGLIDRPFAHAMIQTVHGLGYRLVAAQP